MKRVTWRKALPLIGLWTLLVLFFSTRTEVRGEPFIWIPITWGQALEISLAQWSAWGVLALVIIWIDRHLPLERDALVRRFLFHVPLSVIFTVAYTYLNHAILTLLDAPRDASLLAGGVLGTAWRVIHRNATFFYWVIVGTYIAVDYQNHLKNRLVRTAELERLLSDARLNVLRSQLQPHFLFNALNAVSAHIEDDPRKARLMLERLADLLRLSLDHIDRHEIELEQELDFVERYLQERAPAPWRTAFSTSGCRIEVHRDMETVLEPHALTERLLSRRTAAGSVGPAVHSRVRTSISFCAAAASTRLRLAAS